MDRRIKYHLLWQSKLNRHFIINVKQKNTEMVTCLPLFNGRIQTDLKKEHHLLICLNLKEIYHLK